MIIKEFYKTRLDGVNLYETYSDEEFKIHKVGTDEIYDRAIDVEDAPYVYEETAEKIVKYEDFLEKPADVEAPVEE